MMDCPGPSDQDLVDACNRGDAAAFESLYTRYQDWVVGLARRFCGNDEDALEVLQDAFAYFFRKLPGFELRSRFTTFLYPVVKHLALSRRRGLRRVPSMAEAVAPAPSESIEDLLAGLTEDQKEIVTLRFVDGLDLQSIAEALEIPVGTVKSRLHGALEVLRRKAT